MDDLQEIISTIESYSAMNEILHSDFDIETHKRTFINYLEVVIDKDGTIMYATPSHQQKMIEIYKNQEDLTEDEVWDRIPKNDDVIEWLNDKTGVIAVWNDFYYPNGKANAAQLNQLQILKDNDLYNGEVEI